MVKLSETVTKQGGIVMETANKSYKVQVIWNDANGEPIRPNDDLAEADLQKSEEYPIPADLQPLMDICKAKRLCMLGMDREAFEMVRGRLVVRDLIRRIARLESALADLKRGMK